MSLHASDKKSALMGFLIGAIVIVVVLFGMVRWTSSQFEGHETAAEVG
ncbi:MAG TPA: hypothetical protein VKZ41_08595 [Gemmatimonadales bacterium]|nr:hypothetical protein [Gemmatimonadales bacterium]